MTPEKINELFKRLKKANPEPESELHYSNHFELLVAVILSAQATDKGVNKITPALFAVANTPEKMLALGEAGLEHYIKSINYYKTKAKNLLKTCAILIEKYHGKVPSSREGLESLAGVGRKTANVVLNVAFGETTIAVDTHIFRVANRTGLAHGKTPDAVEKKLLEIIPKKYLHDAHHWLVLHGRYICLARSPKCEICPISDLCEYFAENKKVTKLPPFVKGGILQMY